MILKNSKKEHKTQSKKTKKLPQQQKILIGSYYFLYKVDCINFNKVE